MWACAIGKSTWWGDFRLGWFLVHRCAIVLGWFPVCWGVKGRTLVPAFPQPKRHICQIQLQRGLRDLRSPHCKHSGTPKGVGRQRPKHPGWPDFWTPSIPSLRRDGRQSPIRSRWIQAMSDNWLLYSWPVTNFFWHPRAKMAPRPWLQVRYDAWTGNRIPFVHSHTPVFHFHVLKHVSFTTLILWMFQDRHPCNKFTMTARSHNTAQTLRHLHTKRSPTKWDTHDGRRAYKTSDEADTLLPSHRSHKIDTTRSYFTTTRTHSQFHQLPRNSRSSFINPRCFPIRRPTQPALIGSPSLSSRRVWEPPHRSQHN